MKQTVKKNETREYTPMYWAEIENQDNLDRYLRAIVLYAENIQQEVQRLLEQPDRDFGKARYILTYADKLMENTLLHEKEKEMTVTLEVLKRRQEKAAEKANQ